MPSAEVFRRRWAQTQEHFILQYSKQSNERRFAQHSASRSGAQARSFPFTLSLGSSPPSHPIPPPSIPPPPRCPPPRTHRPRQARSRRRPSAAAAPQLPAARRRPQGACATGREGGAPPPPGPGGGGGGVANGKPRPQEHGRGGLRAQRVRGGGAAMLSSGG